MAKKHYEVTPFPGMPAIYDLRDDFHTVYGEEKTGLISSPFKKYKDTKRWIWIERTDSVSDDKWIYDYTIKMYVPIPYKGDFIAMEDMQKEFKELIRNLIKFFSINPISQNPTYTQMIRSLINDTTEAMNTNYTEAMTDIKQEWVRWLKLIKRMKENKDKYKRLLKLPYYEKYAGGKDFCPLNSLIPDAPLSEWKYAGDLRFYSFITKTDYKNLI